jgi:biopolymer transport protein ExbB
MNCSHDLKIIGNQGDSMYKKGRLAVIVAAFMMAGASVGGLVSYAPAALAADAPAAAAPAAEAPKSAAPVNAPVAPAAAKEIVKVDNPYGLEALWKTGDFVAKGTLLILVIMSMGSWYILVTKYYEQLKMFRQASAARTSFDQARSVQEGVNSLEEGNAFRYIAQTAVEASEHHEGALTENIDRNTWITMSIQRAWRGCNAGCRTAWPSWPPWARPAPSSACSAPCGASTNALTAIGVAGQASIDKVAGPGGRGADHDRHRSGGGRAGGAGLQLAGEPQQGGDGRGAGFRRDLHAVLLGSRVLRPSANAEIGSLTWP